MRKYSAHTPVYKLYEVDRTAVKVLFAQQGVTFEKMAGQLGVTTGAVNHAVVGRNHSRLIARIAHALGVKTTDILKIPPSAPPGISAEEP